MAQVFTFSATSATVTSATKVTLSKGEYPTGSNAIGSQVFHVRALFSTAGATATLQFIWARGDGTGVSPVLAGCMRTDDVTLAATARRQSYDNASGNYTATVTIGGATNGWYDCGGLSPENDGLELYVICTALSAGTVYVEIGTPSRAI